MKNTIWILCLLLSVFAMSFSTKKICTSTETCSRTQGYVDIKIKNDTGEEHKVITSSGGSTTLKNQSGTTTLTVKSGDDLYLYDGGKKGAKIMTVDEFMDGKTFLLSDLI